MGASCILAPSEIAALIAAFTECLKPVINQLGLKAQVLNMLRIDLHQSPHTKLPLPLCEYIQIAYPTQGAPPFMCQCGSDRWRHRIDYRDVNCCACCWFHGSIRRLPPQPRAARGFYNAADYSSSCYTPARAFWPSGALTWGFVGIILWVG